jgi:hypothetical protein
MNIKNTLSPAKFLITSSKLQVVFLIDFTFRVKFPVIVAHPISFRCHHRRLLLLLLLLLVLLLVELQLLLLLLLLLFLLLLLSLEAFTPHSDITR